MDMNVELQAACSSLGYLEKGKYYKEPDCLETLKDLIRFLKREDESCDIRRQIGDSQIVQNDLIYIVKEYKDDRILLETLIRLLVNLTQPAVLCFQNEIPGDKTNRNYYLQIESHLQAYKQAFADEALFAVLTRRLGDLLQLDWESRQEEDRLLVERLLIMIRNILHVPTNFEAEGRTDDDASVHDQLLWAIHVSGMEDLLLYLASSEDERQFSFHVLEIISLMFREQTPEQLAAADSGGRALSERVQDQRQLEMAREQEKAEKKSHKLKCSSRHSRFGGTFVLKNVKSISENQMIYHRSLGQVKDISFDHNKKAKKKPKNRKPLTEADVTRRSTLSIRLFLREFCIQFLENCYNPLMRAVKDILVRSHAQENDETYYLWAMRFFMEFNRKRGKDIRVDMIGETVSVQTFHYIQTNLQNFHEMIYSNKKEGKIWSRRMHLALKAYHELLHTINAMSQSKDAQLRDNANVIKGNVFYMMEYRDIFVLLLKKFDETLQSRAFLKELVEATHLFLKMLEVYCKKHGHLVVQKKKKIRRKRQPRPDQAEPSAEAQQGLEDLWDNVSGELSAIFQGRGEVPTDVTPFDAASEVEVDQQRAEAMGRIQEALRGNKAGEAVALFRAAREVWPEGDQFGAADISAEEEFMALREVFYANIPRASQMEEVVEEEYINASSDEEGAEIQFENLEQDFNFKEFVRRLAQSSVVRSCTILLQDFKKNSMYTNHCTTKILHRIGFDCNLIAMLYQASLFRVFQNIMLDPACRARHFQELQTFAKYVVRSFFETAKQNSKVFVELLFWKTSRDALDVKEGYGTSENNKMKNKQVWTEEQDDELRRLYEEYRDTQEDGMDVLDHIMVHMIDQTRTRRHILKQIKWLGIIESSKDLRPKKKLTQRRGWQEEDEMELRSLYEQHKESSDPMNDILNGLDHPRKRPAVLEKLLELGLIQDKKEMRKRKRKRDSQGKSVRRRKNRKEEVDSDNDEGSEREEYTEEPGADIGNPSVHEAEELLDSSSESDQSSSDSDSWEDEDPLYVVQIKKLCRKVLGRGHGEALKWFTNCLNRCAEDREEDEEDDQPIPIVPLTEEQESAMEDKHFKNLLKRCGMKPPADEQERFWRIPGHLKPDDLRSKVTALRSSDNTERKRHQKKTSEKFENLKNLVKEREQGGRRSRFARPHADVTEDTETAGPTQEVEMTSPTLNQSKKSRLKRTLPSDSEESDTEHLKKDPESSQKKKKQKFVGSSDSEEDSQPVRTDVTASQSQLSTQSSQSQLSTQSSQSQHSTERSQLQMSTQGSQSQYSRESGHSQHSTQSSQSQHSTQSTQSSNNSNSVPDQSIVMSDSDDSDIENQNPSDQLQTFPATMFSQPVSEDDDSDIDDHITLKQVLHKKAARIMSDSEED